MSKRKRDMGANKGWEEANDGPSLRKNNLKPKKEGNKGQQLVGNTPELIDLASGSAVSNNENTRNRIRRSPRDQLGLECTKDGSLPKKKRLETQIDSHTAKNCIGKPDGNLGKKIQENTPPSSVELGHDGNDNLDNDNWDSEEFHSLGKDEDEATSSQYLTPASLNCFKRPDPPPPRQMSVFARTKFTQKEVQKITERQNHCTLQSAQVRKAIIEVIQEHLESISQDMATHIAELLQNMSVCAGQMSYIFATRRFPSGEIVEDLTDVQDIANFARWWLFGLIALLFSKPSDMVRKAKEDIKSLLQTLCQFLLNGHPTTVDDLIPELLKILRDLTHYDGENGEPVLNLNLSFQESSELKQFIYKVKINNENKWAIPHVFDAVSCLWPRMFFFSPKMCHVFLELLLRQCPSSTEANFLQIVLPTFACYLMPAVTYLTESTTVDLIKKLLQTPTLADLKGSISSRTLFNKFDVIHSMTYPTFLEDAGLCSLKAAINEFLHMKKFSSLSLSENDEAMLKVLESIRDKSDLAAETIHSSKLISSIKIKMNSMIESPVLSMDSNLKTCMKAQFCESEDWTKMLTYANIHTPQTSQMLTIMSSCWLKKEGNRRSIHENSDPVKLLINLQASCSIFKFLGEVFKKLDSKKPDCEKGTVIEGLDHKFIQMWCDVVLTALANISGLQPTYQQIMYFTILDTIEILDDCRWFGIKLSLKIISLLLSIPGWIWLNKYDNLLPKKFNPLPEFTKSLCSHVIGSKTLVAKALRVLRMKIFLPWNQFVVNVYKEVINTKFSSLESSLVVELLSGIATIGWPFKILGLKSVFAFLVCVVGSNDWSTHALIRAFLVKAIIALPCVSSYYSSETFHSLQELQQIHTIMSGSGCEICLQKGCGGKGRSSERVGENCDPEQKNLSDGLVNKIIAVAFPLLMSEFILVKIEMAELILRCHNHMKTPSSIVVLPFLAVAVKGKECISESIFEKFGEVLAQSGDMNHACPYRLEVAIKVFTALPHIIAKAKFKGKLALGMSSKILKGFYKLASCSLSLNAFAAMVKCMIQFLAKCDKSEVTVLSQKIVAKYSSVYQCQSYELMSRVRREVSQEILRVAIRMFCKSVTGDTSVQSCADFFGRIFLLGEFRYSKLFTHYYYPTMLEEIVPKLHSEPSYRFLLSAMCTHSKEIEQIVLQDSIMNYYPTLLLDHTSENVSRCLNFLKDKYQFDAVFAAKQQEQKILNEVLCRLDDRQDRVLRCLPHICKWDEASSRQIRSTGTVKPLPRSEIQELLNKRLLGFFLHLDSKLHSRIEPVETKRKVLRSFVVLMQIMGKNKITPLRSKVFKTLNSITDEGADYFDILYEAWKTFAANLDNSFFGQMTSQILAALLPLRKSSPSLCAQVDGLISHFVCFKKELTGANHHELYFLMDQCEAQEVVKTINEAVQNVKSKSWLEYFDLLVRECSHESSNLRYQALKRLRDVFRYDWDRVEKTVLLKGARVISQVLSKLLTGLRSDSDENVRLIITECFGCLGALDPVRFHDVDDIGSKGYRGFIFSNQMTSFGLPYIQVLIREFQEAKDTTNFDYCAYLIQEVLQEYHVQPTKEDPIWGSLPTTSRELITPLLTTKYQMDTSLALLNISCPVYLSEFGQTYDSWLLNWLTYLISCITEVEPRPFSLFNRCKHLLRRNSRIAAFVIPHVAMYAIFCGAMGQRQKMVIEIKTVLERWTKLDGLRNQAHSNVPIKDSQTELGVFQGPTVDNDCVFHSRCTQVIFSILDHLLRSYKYAKGRWGLKKANEQIRATSSKTLTPPMSENNLEALESVLSQIPSSLISQVAFDCESYTCALYYLEQELRLNSTKEKLYANLGYLQRIYVSLNDMDAVVGISAVRKGEPSLCEIVLENIAVGQIEESVRSLERLTALDPSDLIAHNALMQAYLSIEEPWKTRTLIRATILEHPEWETAFQEAQLESFVKLRDWTSLKNKVNEVELSLNNPLQEDKLCTWSIAMARIMSKAECAQFDSAADIIEKLRAKSVAPLLAAAEELHPYKRGYYNIVQLHILEEVEDGIKLLQKHSKYFTSGMATSTQGVLFQDVKRILGKWDARLSNVSSSRKIMDQVLNARKSIFEIMRTFFHSNVAVYDVLSSSIRDCWLDIAREASKLHCFIRADNCLLEAKKFMSPKVLIEEAKILSRKGLKETAISVLQRGINQYFPDREVWKRQSPSTTATPAVEAQILCSKALLLLAKLCEEQKLLDMEDYIAKYKEAADVYKESEKNFFTLGSYHDRLWSSSEQKEKCLEIQATVVRYYSQSLLYGCKYVYQSLPRLLSIWFDFGASVQSGEYPRTSNSSSISVASSDSSGSSGRPDPEAILENMNGSIKRMVAGIPTYILMTAFSQLISRLCHSHKATWSHLRDIIVSIICAHPYQALWMTMAVTKSVNRMRRSRCLEIYSSVERAKPSLKVTIKNYTMLTEKLIDLCDKNIDRTSSKASLSLIFKGLPNLIRNSHFGKVSIPFKNFLNPSLPRTGVSPKDYDPFPETMIYISDIEDTVEVMPSLIRPKKITLRASDGKLYGLMCKPKDDLRKDCKVMEVNNVVNWYLGKNAESNQRRLHVKTFSVVPLNEECGLLEWVPNLQGLRPILLSLYKEKCLVANMRDFRSMIHLHDPLPIKRAKFTDKMLAPTPPLLHEWFFNNFNDHQSWYAARMAYIRTAAVMSLVGYIMGLGDRHGENILLDSATGEVVHVDFNCLFNKGESFEWIERVPFRLTQNMVDAMGPLGYEGAFRRSCEITMNMFREHRSIFLSVLRPFVFDPLVEWGREGKRGGGGVTANIETGEITNEKAVETMKYIRHRLNGTARNLMRDINTELSVEAFVKYLIDEATSIDNLCQMYIGWAAYL